MKNITLVVCLLCATHLIYSQETIPTSGGEATGSGGTSNYSVGQLVYTTNSGSGTVTQGVQQSFEVLTLSSPELTTVNISAVTYPNPTSDYIILNISDSTLSNLSYNLYDVSGKLISNGNITNSETLIKMLSLDSAVYLLKVNQNNQELKSFKIIKN
ncbi:MAG: T9SS type A sorting domain-containing protein [Flaviramulus sp.]|nr:T9SS type A sorting domain-containing protein [Flaviramulus sp.]NNC50527.1 T9SS type A sorting domain-containing protein [Flaviramulus sp.]